MTKYEKGSRYEDERRYIQSGNIFYPVEPDRENKYHIVLNGKPNRKGTFFTDLPEDIQDSLKAEYKRRFKLVMDRATELMDERKRKDDEEFERTFNGSGYSHYRWPVEKEYEFDALIQELRILELKYNKVEDAKLMAEQGIDDKRKKPWDWKTKTTYSWQIATGHYTELRKFKSE